MGRAARRLAGARPDADDPDLRLSHPDAAAVRQQPGLGDDRHRPSSRRRRWCAPPCSACRGCRRRSSDFAEMAGCTARQKLWRVLLPSARPTLMVGVNQVIMLALNMVIIASMIGAGGLGYDVLLALRALKVGEAMEAGLAIVALAIALDRLSQAVARRQAAGPRRIRPRAAASGALSQPDAGRRHPCRDHACSACSSRPSPRCRRRSPSPPRRPGRRRSTGSPSTSSTRSRRSASR